MSDRLTRMAGAAIVAAALAAGAWAEDGPGAGGAGRVLDIDSYWRSFLTFSPVVYAEKAEGAQTPEGEPRSAPPPAGWTGTDFDDSRWFRFKGPLFCGGWGGWGWTRQGGGSTGTSMVCLRGKFNTPDPAKVKSLSLSLIYRGGAVVYLNGEEAARGHLGDGAITPLTLAQEYPWEAYVDVDGKKPLPYRGKGAGYARTKEQNERLAFRDRRLENISLPVTRLKKGVNVVAIELHRAPIHPGSLKLRKRWSFTWSTTGLREATLTATPGTSVNANTTRPSGIQIWNENLVADVYTPDYGDPNEPLRPIRIVGARNGSFSARVVVGSDAPIQGLTVAMSDLKAQSGAGTIPAAMTRVRYGLPTGKAGQEGRMFWGVGNKKRFDGLAESPPATVPVRKIEAARGYKGLLPASSAALSVRVTIQTPSDAEPGDYEGALTISAVGLEAAKVPVKVKVVDWTLPDVSEFSTHLGVIQSIETLAHYYKAPMWSDKHWKLIDRSFRILGRAGTDALFLPLVMKHHFGKEALVRWVKKEDGAFSQDYAVFDRYVDTALRYMKKPEVVCLYVWDPQCAAVNTRHPEKKQPMPLPLVPLFDPATGAVTEMECPRYNTEECVAFWKPVLDACRARLLERGVPDEAIMFGMSGDRGPSKAEVEIMRKIAPWAKWIVHSHQPPKTMGGLIPVGHSVAVWGVTNFEDPSVKRSYGWRTKAVLAAFPRTGAGPSLLKSGTCLSGCLIFQESCLLAGCRGAARVGAEFWQIPSVVKERSYLGGLSLLGQYSHWGRTSMANSAHELLVPGPEGALSTARLETVYEGSQEAEARVFIEKAMLAHKDTLSIDGLSPAETRKHLQDLLDRRTRAIIAYRAAPEWYSSSGWEDRAAEIYEAAAKVAKASKK